jgi:glycosyltransferase involved in cell wall biosynthesis
MPNASGDKTLSLIEFDTELIEENFYTAMCGEFDPLFYWKMYPDIFRPEIDPIEHFHHFGWREGRDPCQWFSVDHYLRAYSDVRRANVNPFVYHLLFGHLIGRSTARSSAHQPLYQARRSVLPPRANVTVARGARTVRSEELYRFATLGRPPLAPSSRRFEPTRLNLHWVIPDFVAGAGGQMNICRICNYLEARGHRITFWIRDPTFHSDPTQARETLHRHFQHLAAEVFFIDGSFGSVSGDIVIATDAYTVPIVLSASQFKRRFYFVQDFESTFGPAGTRSLLPESTYRAGLDCICGGPWLQALMADKYGQWSRMFWQAADRTIYKPAWRRREHGHVPRIAFYARMFTDRRAVELGLLALELLARRSVMFHVDFFGQEELPFNAAPYSATNHGVCESRALAELYAAADVGMVFSATNYSIVSQEMMACRLPILDLDVDSTRAVYGEGTVRLAEPEPHSIAEALEDMLSDEAAREAQADRAEAWVSQFSWSASAELVEKAFIDRLVELSFKAATPSIRRTKDYVATVVIPTYNGGKLLKKVVAMVQTQRLPADLHFVCIDSSSTDGTNEYLKQCGVDLITIPQCEFQHGRTRNQGVEAARAEFVAFLTQDALPINDMWLHNLIAVLRAYSRAGAVFGRHVAYEDASYFVQCEVRGAFAQFDGLPVCIDPADPWVRDRFSDIRMRQLFHFYSDNNACLRKSVWRHVPLPNVDFGEDQAFALQLLTRGYGKAYARNAVVYHSHDDPPVITEQRAYEEARFYYNHFAYTFPASELELMRQLHSRNIEAIELARERGIPDAQLQTRIAQNEAVIRGWARAMREAGFLQPGNPRLVSDHIQPFDTGTDATRARESGFAPHITFASAQELRPA